jgi:uncharacterized protein
LKTLLIDTSAIHAYSYEGDINHGRIRAFLKREARDSQFVVSNYVFDETMTLLKSHFGAYRAIQVGQMVRSSRLFQLIYLTPEDEQSTWEIFQKYADKRWSYTDCSVLALMRRMGVNDVVAFDDHFQQMGVAVHPA